MKNLLAIALISAATAGFSGVASAAPNEAKMAYTSSNDAAASQYKTARAQCDSLTGNPKDVCIAQAKAARTHTEADAKALYKNTLSARTSARKTIAEADYSVDKAKCGSQTGNAKDVCIKEAKATKIAAMSDAKADKQVTEARTDARDDKRTAEYKVAQEKCDALAGPAKDACVAAAKAQFGK